MPYNDIFQNMQALFTRFFFIAEHGMNFKDKFSIRMVAIRSDFNYGLLLASFVLGEDTNYKLL